MAERGYFFVCGAPKSGTTWLQRMLDAHPQIHCSGEGNFIAKFSVPLAEVLRGYDRQLKAIASGVYEGKPYYPQITQADFDRLARGFILERLLSRNPGPEILQVGDKTPRYARELPSLLRLFPEARFINILRDPRDVTMSRMHHARRTGHEDRVAEGSAARIQFVKDSGKVWRDTVTAVVAFEAENPGILHTVRYEDMLADPGEAARRIFQFLGVRDDTTLTEQIVAATSFEAMSGRKPGEEHPTSFLWKGIAGGWAGKLEPEALGMIDEVCGEHMRAYGYV